MRARNIPKPCVPERASADDEDMALISCPDCDSQISDLAPACPGCGRPNESGASAIKCPACSALQKRPPGTESATCPSCGESIVISRCATTKWSGPVLTKWTSFTHAGCKIAHTPSGAPVTVTERWMCPGCGSYLRVDSGTSRTTCPCCHKGRRLYECRETGWSGAVLLTRSGAITHSGCKIVHPAPLPTNPDLVCPYCQTRGRVTISQVKVKGGISGGKATGAILTGGFSLLATGLSRVGYVTQKTCGKCLQTWTF
jgi:hypothetical protein